MFTLSYGPPTSVNPTFPCESLSWLHVILVFVQGNQHERVYGARIRTWETHQWRQQAFPPSAIPQMPIVPQGRVGLYKPLLAINEYWLTWAVSCRPGAYSCSELLIPTAMSCPFSPSSGSCVISVPSSMMLRYLVYSWEYPVVTLLQHSEQPRVSAFTIICYKKTLLWLRMRDAFVYGEKSKYLEFSLTSCSFGETAVVGSYLEPRTSSAMGFSSRF